MDFEYVSLYQRDMHNKCCNGRAWCVKVISTEEINLLSIVVHVHSFYIARIFVELYVRLWHGFWFSLPVKKMKITKFRIPNDNGFSLLNKEFVVMAVILLPSQYPVYKAINTVIFNILSFLAISSHLRTMFSDPVSYPALIAFHFLSVLISFRELCRKETLQRKWFNSLDSKKDKCFSNVRNVVA